MKLNAPTKPQRFLPSFRTDFPTEEEKFDGFALKTRLLNFPSIKEGCPVLSRSQGKRKFLSGKIERHGARRFASKKRGEGNPVIFLNTRSLATPYYVTASTTLIGAGVPSHEQALA